MDINYRFLSFHSLSTTYGVRKFESLYFKSLNYRPRLLIAGPAAVSKYWRKSVARPIEWSLLSSSHNCVTNRHFAMPLKTWAWFCWGMLGQAGSTFFSVNRYRAYSYLRTFPAFRIFTRLLTLQIKHVMRRLRRLKNKKLVSW